MSRLPQPTTHFEVNSDTSVRYGPATREEANARGDLYPALTSKRSPFVIGLKLQLAPRPDVLISGDGHNVGVRGKDGSLHLMRAAKDDRDPVMSFSSGCQVKWRLLGGGPQYF
jgi:hypothetical protein